MRGACGPHDEVTLFEALADPIVQALMAADGVDREGLETLMRCIATLLRDDMPKAREIRAW